jgi:tight adherence protein C
MAIQLIALCASATLFFIVLILFGGRSELSRRVAELEKTAKTSSAPVVSQSVVFRKILANVDRTAIGAKLAEAGWYQTTVSKFVATRLAAAAVGGLLGFGVSLLLGTGSWISFAAPILGAVVGMSAPSFAIDGAIKKRKTAIMNRLPDLLDLVATTVEAGTALNAALASATASLTGPLAEEIAIVLSDIRIGRTRADAFNGMASRVKQEDLSSLVTALVQTEKLGGNIGNVLDELADEARSRRLMRAEEIAASLPVKMVVPMALFMLPALFVMIFTPVIANMGR